MDMENSSFLSRLFGLIKNLPERIEQFAVSPIVSMPHAKMEVDCWCNCCGYWKFIWMTVCQSKGRLASHLAAQ